ncbi:uncharacterized protein Smp_200650 [Schistosoma mansoni]|uniref:Smp_200650 n=1 Tax=Schistosoma mansoni TaxID=6183 RepID=G4VB74_SCHMA|nr:uncharacterized protein Smp_200650 [Schistosoma mansoni]|eukprot:XP_018649457.1 uncharacterized protein Smp_200650 [Schistosoma mansoni]
MQVHRVKFTPSIPQLSNIQLHKNIGFYLLIRNRNSTIDIDLLSFIECYRMVSSLFLYELPCLFNDLFLEIRITFQMFSSSDCY